MRRYRPLLAVGALLVGACAPLRTVVENVLGSGAERLAAEVVIRRDEWGVPHIYGTTDAAVAFGLAYAQAEDAFLELEERTIRALGRSAELYGRGAVPADLVRAAFDVQRLAREEYDREPDDRKRIWDAFALGIDYYLETHPDVRPKLLARFEPWYIFAIARELSAGMVIDGVRLGPDDGVSDSPASAPFHTAGAYDSTLVGQSERWPGPPPGSLAWAVAPARSESGTALLFAGPNGSFATSDLYEAHVESEEGWRFAGFVTLGTPAPRFGHNGELGWGETRSSADVADVWSLYFDHPSDSLAYRYAGDWRQASTRQATIGVRTDSGVVSHGFRFRVTHHGPVIAAEGARGFAVRVAGIEEGGAIQQRFAMSQATSLDAFRAALDGAALPGSAFVYADRGGNILYVHASAVPKRDPGFDWTRPLDGADPATEWQGYLALAELPQVLNPRSGWLDGQGAQLSLEDDAGAAAPAHSYPRYVIGPTDESGKARTLRARALLAAETSWTFDDWSRAAFDTRFFEPERRIAALVDEWERLGALDPDRALRLDSVVDSLRQWDGVADDSSIVTTHYVLWHEQLEGIDPAAEWPHVTSLEVALSQLDLLWGTTTVPWGEINRHQRPSAGRAQDSKATSLAVVGAPGDAGIIFDYRARPGAESGVRFGTHGRTATAVIAFESTPRMRTVIPFGQSADTASKHFLDQATLYARGALKEAWFAREDVERATTEAYAPGTREAGVAPVGSVHR